MTPLISIIIPTYNRAHLIGDTLNSIKNQTYSNWECVVVDDGSSDNTAAVLSSWTQLDDRFSYVQRPLKMPKGPNSCRNYGYLKSKGDFIQWFDSDDLYKPNALEIYVSKFGLNIDVVIGKLERIDLETGKKIDENIILSKNTVADYLVGNITYYVSGPLWRKSFLEKQPELFDEHIRNMDDWDFNLRMLYGNPRIHYLEDALIAYRMHENSLVKELNKINKAEIASDIKAREKHIALLKENKAAPFGILEKLIAQRYLRFLRWALFNDGQHKGYLLKKTLGAYFRIKDLPSCVKILVGFISYRLFKKGYALLKK